MKTGNGSMSRRLVCGVALVACLAARKGIALAQYEYELRYQAECVVTPDSRLLGYVRNDSGDAYQVNGLVRFEFYSRSRGGMTHAGLEVAADAVVPPGQRVQVSQTGYPYALTSDDECRLDVKDAIRKL